MSLTLLGKVLPADVCKHVAKFLKSAGDPESIWAKGLTMTYLYNRHGNPCFRLDRDSLLETRRFSDFYVSACTPFWDDGYGTYFLEVTKRDLVRFYKNRRCLCGVELFKWRPRATHFLPRYPAAILKQILS